jgi:adenylate cyclase
MKSLQRAIELDPDYADAYSWLSYVNSMETYFTSSDTSVNVTRAMTFAKRAVALDRHSETAYMALGLAFRAARQHDRAIDACDKALALNPNNADVFILKASPLAFIGQADDAIDCIANAKRLNPHYPEFYDWPLGMAYFQARRYQDAVEALNRLSEQNANSIVWLAASYSCLQRSEKMLEAASELLKLDPDFRLSTTPTVKALANVEDQDHLREALRGLALPE